MTYNYKIKAIAPHPTWAPPTDEEIHSAMVRAHRERAEMFAKLLQGGIDALRKLI